MPGQTTRSLLILGGSGFISGTLARQAVRRGYQVWAVTRGRRALPEGVTALTVDRHEPGPFQEAIENTHQNWDLVVDCIGYDPQDARQDIELFRQRARQLIFISTEAVYHPVKRSYPQPEEALAYQEGDNYGGKKRLGEMEFLRGDCHPMQWTVVRPNFVYGPGSLPGNLPLHRRDALLLNRLRAGQPLRLVGGGHFLQHPVFVEDLAQTLLSLDGNPRSYSEIFNVGGPEIVEVVENFRLIAAELEVELKVEELKVSEHLAAHPEDASNCCNRIYDLSKLRASGASVPATRLAEGMHAHVADLL